MRVAIVSDPLVQRGGAERVVEQLAQAFPDAPVYTILYSPESGPASLRERIITSSLQRIPGATRHHRFFLPFYPGAVESFDLRGYDVVISSHHTVAKGLLRNADTLHVCYCHTPMRALWERPQEELASVPSIARPFATSLFSKLRVWDVATVNRVDAFIANSEETRTRIRKHYNRESIVINPPIDVDRFTPGTDTRDNPGADPSSGSASDYYLIASRPVPYKRIDVAVDACIALGKRAIVVGGVPKNVRTAPNVELRGHVSDKELVTLMRGARALLFPQLEDFGMTPLEMMACGRPVIAYGRGGACETVMNGTTGLLVPEQTPEAFAQAINQFETQSWNPQACRTHAEQFSAARFRAAIHDYVEGVYRDASR